MLASRLSAAFFSNRSTACLAPDLTAVLSSLCSNRLKICWIDQRATAVMAGAAADAAPSVATAAATVAISSMAMMPSSMYISIFAAWMSVPHDSMSAPMSRQSWTSVGRSESGSPAMPSQAWSSTAPIVVSPPPNPATVVRPPVIVRSMLGASTPWVWYQWSARSQTTFSLPSGHSTPTTHSRASTTMPGALDHQASGCGIGHGSHIAVTGSTAAWPRPPRRPWRRSRR
jgi:hypothetical protein